jgi:Kef-type K+ transport system membrane component KefB
MLPVPPLSLEFSSYQLEVAETLIQVGRFVVIFFAARAIAEVMVRLQLPTILGELVAGVLIGVSGLHLIVPPETQAQLSAGVTGLVGSLAQISPEVVQEVYNETFPSLQAVSQLGLFALLFLTGLESELDELVAVGVQASTVAVAGVVLPFALGTAGLYFLFHVPLIPAVFAGAAMTATSIGITASVFGELKWLKRKEGQIVIGAAVLDDIIGIVILAVVVAIVGGGAFSLGPGLKLCLAAVAFVAVALVLSRKAAPAFDWVVDRLKAPGDVAVALAACRRADSRGQVWLEADMRAHRNPTRMRSIRRVGVALARRLATPCPSCMAPGWACWTSGGATPPCWTLRG